MHVGVMSVYIVKKIKKEYFPSFEGYSEVFFLQYFKIFIYLFHDFSRNRY